MRTFRLTMVTVVLVATVAVVQPVWAGTGRVMLPQDKVTPVGFHQHYDGGGGCDQCGDAAPCDSCGDCGPAAPSGGCGACGPPHCPYLLGGLLLHVHHLKQSIHWLLCYDPCASPCGPGRASGGCTEGGGEEFYGDDVDLVPTPSGPAAAADPFEDDTDSVMPRGSMTRRSRSARPTARYRPGYRPANGRLGYRSRVTRSAYALRVPVRPSRRPRTASRYSERDDRRQSYR